MLHCLLRKRNPRQLLRFQRKVKIHFLSPPVRRMKLVRNKSCQVKKGARCSLFSYNVHLSCRRTSHKKTRQARKEGSRHQCHCDWVSVQDFYCRWQPGKTQSFTFRSFCNRSHWCRAGGSRGCFFGDFDLGQIFKYVAIAILANELRCTISSFVAHIILIKFFIFILKSKCCSIFVFGFINTIIDFAIAQFQSTSKVLINNTSCLFGSLL